MGKNSTISPKAGYLAAALSAVCLLLSQQDSSALRTAPGQVSLSAISFLGKDSIGYGILPYLYTPSGRIGAGVSHLFTSAESSLNGSKVPFEEYGLSLTYGGRIVSSISRSFSLCAGGGPMSSYQIMDPKGTLPGHIRSSLPKRSLTYGLTGNLTAQVFILPSVSVEAGISMRGDFSGKRALPFQSLAFFGVSYNFR